MAVADRTLQILPGGQSAAPFSYVLPASTSFNLLAVRATFDGSAAASAFLPCVQLVSDAGQIMAQTIGSSVAAGGSADASFFPFVRTRATTPSSLTYSQVIAAFKSSYTCVAEWRLSDGSTPYADTSGFSPGTPATLTRQVSGTAMTQALASGPLASTPTGPSVRFNFDGTSATGTGDFLTDALVDASRYYFIGNLPFTVVAWLLPSVPVNTHHGPAVSTVHVTSFGNPNARDDGWRINVEAPTNVCSVQRYSNVQIGQVPDSVTIGTLSATQWQMVVMTYDGANLRGYLNGALIGSAASAGAIGGSSINVKLGVDNVPLGGSSNYYFGADSQVSVWAATFTANDVATLYSAGVS